MRTASTERFIIDDMITSAISSKSFVDKLDTLGGVENTVADMDTADFVSRATEGDLTKTTVGFDTFPPFPSIEVVSILYSFM